MRRFRKIFILVGACAAALGLSIRHHGEDLRVEAHAPLRAAPRTGGGAYDLSQLPIFGRTVHFVQTNYFDKSRMDPKRMLVGALDILQRDVPEILVDRSPEADPKQVTVRVNGNQQVFPIENVDSPWALHAAMKRIFAFVQPRLQPVSPKEEARRLVEIEMAATNGMLNTLDPHSVLLDVESYKEMRTQTQGKFGGLGIIIEMDRKGRISVKRPMHDTPAFRAGIKSKDHIVRINNESTINMTLQEAVDRLRGDPGTTVDVYIERTGQTGTKKFSITRDFIKPPAIDPEQIRTLQSSAQPGQPPATIGYFRIGSFSFNAERDLNDVLAQFEQKKVKGLIMDLRTNPGGLYDQAQKVADAFIDSGTLVSMVGVGGSQRKDETATRGGNNKLPLVVLVNQNSASASEIVAGAVKNLDRGVVIGETTFGKGSVQMLFDIPSPVPFGSKSDDDRLGLKLTTAQYLTPGDLSIQGVGVTPDIDLVSMRVQKYQDEMWIRLQKSARRRQESDLESHLDHPSARRGQKPSEVISYLFVPPPGSEKKLAEADEDDAHPDADEDEAEAEAAEDNQIDFMMEFARDFLAQYKGAPRRRDMLQASKVFLDKVRAEEDKKLSAALEKLGVEWSAGPASPSPSQVQVSLATLGGGAKVAAGSSFKLRGAVKNLGQGTLHRVRAVLKSDNPLFDENEMVFGKIAPGETKNYDLIVKVPKNMPTRTDIIKPQLFATGAVRSNDAELAIQIDGKARPLFAYNYQTVDTGTGNGDGLVQRGERVKLLVTVKNMGAGPAVKTDAILRNGPGQEGILISAGRFDTRDLAAGASKNFAFTYEVSNEFKGDEYQLELVVGDTVLGESVTDKIKIKVAPPGPAPESASGTATIAKADAVLREAASGAALAVARAPKGGSYKVTGKQSGFLRVELGPGQSVFVSEADVSLGGGGAGGASSAQPIWQVAPPVLAVNAASAVTSPSVHLKGLATDDQQVKDIYIRVFNRDSKLPAKKVFYLPNRGDKTKLSFETDVPLWPGSNIIQVFARETNEVQSTAMLVVLQKQAPSLVQKVNGTNVDSADKVNQLKPRSPPELLPPAKGGATSVGK